MEVRRMNRLESIKETWKDFKDHDVSYLLQRLEIAQKALEKAYELDGYMFIRMALDQIKE